MVLWAWRWELFGAWPGWRVSALGQESVEGWEGAGGDMLWGMRVVVPVFVAGMRSERSEPETLLGAVGELWVRVWTSIGWDARGSGCACGVAVVCVSA